MNTNSSKNSYNRLPLPPELKEALDQETSPLDKELERVWDITGIALTQPSASSAEEMDAMWSRMQAVVMPQAATASVASPRRIRMDRDAISPQSRSSKRSSLIGWTAAVSTFVMLLGIAAVAYWTMPISVIADRGQIAEASLPDGSIVTLNSGSSLTYQRGFDGNPFSAAKSRNVQLEGEGFFEVNKSTKPFTVHTFNANVAVLGTEFNVRAWSRELKPESKVTLVSGHVQVAVASDMGSTQDLMTPGQTVIVRDETFSQGSPVVEDFEAVISWQERGLAISSKTLDAVFGELERRYDITITVEDNKILNDSLTLLMPKPEGVESIISDICVEKDLRYRKTSRGYVIYRSAS